MLQTTLVTGAAGYIGSVLVRQLLQQGHHVIGFDKLLFGGESLLEIINHPRFRFIKGDLNDAEAVGQALQGVRNVVHLAAIVGDKACQEHADEARATMGMASQNLYQQAATAGVKHIIFASTCSNYGMMEGQEEAFLEENAPLQPQSLYAELKVAFEKYLLDRNELPSTILRFATVYGSSPRIRFDLSVNHFTRDICLGRPLHIFGANTWRPYCHVSDLAQSVLIVLTTGSRLTAGKVFNVGENTENFTKAQLIELIQNQIPEAEVTLENSSGNDPRNYRVDFQKIKSELGFQIQKRVSHGILEIRQLVESGILPDYDSPRYRNA